MSANREKIEKEANEIKDIEALIGARILRYVQENEDRAFSISELMRIGTEKDLGIPLYSIVVKIIIQLVKEGNLKAFDYKGQLLMAAK